MRNLLLECSSFSMIEHIEWLRFCDIPRRFWADILKVFIDVNNALQSWVAHTIEAFPWLLFKDIPLKIKKWSSSCFYSWDFEQISSRIAYLWFRKNRHNIEELRWLKTEFEDLIELKEILWDSYLKIVSFLNGSIDIDIEFLDKLLKDYPKLSDSCVFNNLLLRFSGINRLVKFESMRKQCLLNPESYKIMILSSKTLSEADKYYDEAKQSGVISSRIYGAYLQILAKYNRYYDIKNFYYRYFELDVKWLIIVALCLKWAYMHKKCYDVAKRLFDITSSPRSLKLMLWSLIWMVKTKEARLLALKYHKKFERDFELWWILSYYSFLLWKDFDLKNILLEQKESINDELYKLWDL